MVQDGPVVLDQVNDAFIDPCRLLTVIWEGATTAGDTAELRSRASDNTLWKGRTDTTHTYLGANFGPEGIHAPSGFYVFQLSAGTLYAYLRQA